MKNFNKSEDLNCSYLCQKQRHLYKNAIIIHLVAEILQEKRQIKITYKIHFMNRKILQII